MKEITVQPLSPDKLEKAFGILKEGLVHEDLNRELAREKLFFEAGEPFYSKACPLAAFSGKEMIGVMGGHIIPRFKTGYVGLFAVKAEHRRKGVASALTAELERLFKKEGMVKASVLDCPCNYLDPGLDPFYMAGAVCLEKNGYQKQPDVRFHMLVRNQNVDFNLRDSMARLKEKGYQIRRAAWGDEPGIQEFMQRIFGQESRTACAWTWEATKGLDRNPPSTHLMVNPSGVITAFASALANNITRPWFGPMATDPACRGLGAGRILLVRCIQDIAEAGFENTIIPWAGPFSFYKGAVNAEYYRNFWVFAKELFKPDSA
jgi:mycothiol synthase